MTGPTTPHDPFSGPGRAGADPLEAVRQVFADEPVVPLVPRPGTFEAILAEASHRRRAHRRRLAGGAAALVAAAAAVAVVVPLGLLPDRSTTRTTAAASPTERPTSAVAKSVAPAPATTTAQTPTTSDALPAGGPVPAGTRVVSVTTAAAGTLYALGSAPCSAATCAVLARSLDDGATWVGLPPPAVAVVDDAGARVAGPGTDPAGSIRDVRFAGARDGWAFGASTWVTHDGAARTSSWTRVDTGGTVLDLATDGRTVWALAADCRSDQQGAGTACRQPRLLTGAADGDRLDVDAAATALLPAQLRSASVQVAAGQVVVDVDGPAPVVLARDGGSWRRVAPPSQPAGCTDPTVVPAANQAPGEAVLWSSCPLFGSGAAGSSAVSLATSSDGGRTWVPAGTLQVRNGVTVLAAVDAQRAAVATGAQDLGGSLRGTVDRGAHWADGTRLPWATGGWGWVGAAGGGHLLALPLEPTGTIWASTDAGRTWQALTVR